MTTPPAALAIIRAAIEDAHLAEMLHRPGMTAQRIARTLEAEGWTITPDHTPNGPQRPA